MGEAGAMVFITKTGIRPKVNLRKNIGAYPSLADSKQQRGLLPLFSFVEATMRSLIMCLLENYVPSKDILLTSL
jgi:hypothetical protein